jgi:uncharacterized OB-fold protein
MEKKDLLTIYSGEMAQPFNWSVGRYGSKFLTELRDHKKIFGIKCPSCGRVYVPPRRVCGRCFVEMFDWVELPPRGTLAAFTVLMFSFVDPDTGLERPVPYGYGYVKFDGADSTFPHFLEETDYKKIKIGQRVEAVFEEKRRGHLLDIKYFRILSE